MMATSFKRSHGLTATLSAPDPAAGHQQPMPPPQTPGHSQASLGQSVGSPLLSPVSWCTRFCLCPPRVYFPVLCTFWQLYDGVSGDRLQKGLCHIQVCCTQSPCPCGSPLPTHTSAGDSWMLTGKSGSVSCQASATFSWVLVCTRLCLCPLRVCFPVLCKFLWLYGGFNGDFLQETLKHSSVSVSVGSLGPGAHKVCLSPLSIPGG